MSTLRADTLQTLDSSVTIQIEDLVTAGNVGFKVVNTLADIKTVTSGDAQLVYTRGYSAINDGGAGVYQYDATDVVTAGNDFLVVQANDGGRYKLRVSGPVSIKQAGAGLSDVADSSPGVQRALDAVNAFGYPELYAPAGVYRLATGVVCSGKPLTLRGAGKGLSQFRYEGTTFAISVTPSDIQQNVTLSDFAIYPAHLTVASGRPLRVSYPTSGSWVGKTVDISNLSMNSNLTGGTFPYWAGGMFFKDCWNGVVRNVWFTGKANDWLTTTDFIELSDNCTDFVIDSVHGCFCINAIAITGYMEGVSVTNSTFVKIYRGVNQQTASFLNLRFRGNHVNAVSVVFNMNNAAQNNITNNLLYLTDPAAVTMANFVACNSGQYAYNTCINLGNITSDGFNFTGGATQNSMTGNNFEGCVTGILLNTASSKNRAALNTRFIAGVAGPGVDDLGTGNTVTT